MPIEKAALDGDVRPDLDPAIAARLLFGMVNSIVEWYRPGRGDTELARVAREMAFGGLRIRRPAGPALSSGAATG